MVAFNEELLINMSDAREKLERKVIKKEFKKYLFILGEKKILI